MKFLEIDVSKSINPNSGEHWYKCNAKVSVDEKEVPEEVFQELKKRLDSWLPNPFETTVIKYKVPSEPENISNKEIDAENNRLFEELKVGINKMPTKEKALEFLQTTEFKFSIEAKQYINSKTFTNGK